MKCPECGFQPVETIKSEVAGAVYISRDSGGGGVWVSPALFGLRKWEGCVEFGSGYDNDKFIDGDDDYRLHFSSDECKALYYDYPPLAGTAWLVTPHKNGVDYEWEQVDQLIEFTD